MQLSPLRQFLPYWAAMPAMVTSLWLLHLSQAPRPAQVLQRLAIAFASLTYGVLRSGRIRLRCQPEWLALVLILCLFAPLLPNAQHGPERWIFPSGVRLYVAPIVLFLLEASPIRAPSLYATSVIAATAALVLQPDASQASAFAAGIMAFALSGTRRSLHIARQPHGIPDPLLPVPHAEGIFSLAAQVSPAAFVAALACAGLPVAALAGARSRGTLAVALYYAALFAQAPLQVTPVPLLGFGAGPVPGYFLAAAMVSRDVDAG